MSPAIRWPQMSRAAAEATDKHPIEFGTLYDYSNGEPARPASEKERDRAREELARYGFAAAVVRGRYYTWEDR